MNIQVKRLIREREEQFGWEFVFIAANIDAVETADKIGIRPERAANYRQDEMGTRASYRAMSRMMTEMRNDCVSKEHDLQSIYDEEENKND